MILLPNMVSRPRPGAASAGVLPDDVYLFTDMAVMIDGIARKAASPP